MNWEDSSLNVARDDREIATPSWSRPATISRATSRNNSTDDVDRIEEVFSSPRKRKRAISRLNNLPKAKRLRGHYVDEYRQVFNEEVNDAKDRFVCRSQEKPLSGSQIGLSYWTAQEKELFFIALAKLGKDAIREIAVAISTKSELEVRDYLLLLQDGLVEHVLNDRQQVLMSLGSLLSAAELSEECCQSLDFAGEALAWYQANHESKLEERKHGENWLLTCDTADKIEQEILGLDPSTPSPELEPTVHDEDHLDEQGILPDTNARLEDSEDDDRLNIMDQIPAAKLLNLRQFLILSESLFMNSSQDQLEDNWQSIAERGEEPSIYFTAFEDFHRLVVSITKRLVIASLFQANARVRGEDWRKSHITKPNVRKRDVATAIEIVGMKTNSREFWARAPRRCGLHCFARQTDQQPMEYDDIEIQLGFPPERRGLPQDEDAQKEFTAPESDEELSVDEENDNYDNIDNIDNEDDSDTESSNDSLKGFQSNQESRRRKFEHKEDRHAELVDQARSRHEERAMWDILQQSPPEHLRHELNQDDPVFPSRGPSQRRQMDQLVDWRDWTKYRGPWEELAMVKELDAQEVPIPNVVRDTGDLRNRYIAPPQKHQYSLPLGHRKKDRRDTSRHGSRASSENSQVEEREESTQSRVLAPREARTNAASQIQETPFLPDADASSSDGFDPTA